MSPGDISILAGRCGFADVAQIIADRQLNVTTLSQWSREKIGTIFDMDALRAHEFMRFIGSILFSEQSCKIRKSTCNLPLGELMSRFHLPYWDPLFCHVCGFQRLLAMPLTALGNYLQSSGAVAARITQSVMPRIWAQNPSQELRNSIAHLSRLEMGKIPSSSPSREKCVQDLLLLSDADLDSVGIKLAVHELFDFFSEYSKCARAKAPRFPRIISSRSHFLRTSSSQSPTCTSWTLSSSARTAPSFCRSAPRMTMLPARMP
jgi:hypothetical protein